MSGMDYNEANRILSRAMATLQQERESQDISLRKLGAMTGLHRTSIGLMESGQRSATVVSCLRLADALGLDFADVLRSVTAKKRRKRPAD
jgi:transcriptional regulator with XRE-family HTH domain